MQKADWGRGGFQQARLTVEAVPGGYRVTTPDHPEMPPEINAHRSVAVTRMTTRIRQAMDDGVYQEPTGW